MGNEQGHTGTGCGPGEWLVGEGVGQAALAEMPGINEAPGKWVP